MEPTRRTVLCDHGAAARGSFEPLGSRKSTGYMSEQKSPYLPIGYWVRKVDETLTAQINEAQEVNGLSRTTWQVLNVLHDMASTTLAQLAEPLRPFADAGSLADVIDRLAERGLIEGERSASAGFRLTDQGRRVHQAALERQKEVRQRAVRGVSEADYLTTVQVLQRVAENLTGPDAAQQSVATDDDSRRR
jgi:DNA-binding MarR family transcriptional regulator